MVRARSRPPGLRPRAGGGALLDLGVCPLSFASMILGRPTAVTAMSRPAFCGVDAQTAVLLGYDGGRLAILFSSLEAHTPSGASINGTLARIEIDGDFLAPNNFRVVDRDGAVIRYEQVHHGRGLRHQVTEVGRCLRLGLTESSALPLDETVSTMETLDEVRRQIGLRYPGESSLQPSAAG